MKFLRLLWLMMVLPAAAAWAADAVPAQPDTNIINTRLAWQKVAEARDAAGKESHHEAVADYLEALASDARLVKTVAQEIAYQKLWREDADKAIFYFKRYLARHPDEINRDVRKGLAQAYSWSGRQKEAIVLYRQLVAEDRSDGAARLGLGRSLIWNNELKEGYRVVRSIENEFPAGSAPGRESSDFLLTVMDSYTTHMDLRGTGSWDSDGLDIYRTTADLHFQVLGNKLLEVAPTGTLYQMPDKANIFSPKLQFGLVGTMARNWSFHVYAWIEHFRSREPISNTATDELKWTRPGGDFWITWIAMPRLRMDFGGSNMVVETYPAFDNHLYFNQASVSADWRFARKFTLGAVGIYGDYSDGNTKRSGSAHLYWNREGKVKIMTGPTFTYMDFTDPYPGGYWAPDWVRNGSWRLLLETRRGRMTFKLDGSVGLEQELGSDALTVAGAAARWGWRLGDRTLVSAEAGYSRSRFTSASGYNRKFVGLNFKAMF